MGLTPCPLSLQERGEREGEEAARRKATDNPRADARAGYSPQPLEHFVEGVATKDQVDFAREQRREGTAAENALWDCLRGRKIGFKFRRQHPCGDFVLDFFCEEARLAVEVDGPHHDQQRGYDQWRDERLLAMGIRTLRLPAQRLESRLPEVLGDIARACQAGVADRQASQ